MDSQTPAKNPNLLEREAELEALDHALAAAVEGRGSVVAVEGPPGIGKSRLVTSCAELARARGMYTVSVRATELERSYPYGIVRQSADSVALDKTDEERAALFAGAAKLALPILDPGSAEQADNPELMYQRLHGLYWLTANMARQQPLLVTIDDAQWADEASMAAERFVSLRIADLPMVLLLAVRPADVGQLAVPLAEILADPATVSIRPGPLSVDGAGRRIEALLGSSDPAFAAACHHATGGNPFLLEQLLSEVRAEGIEPSAESADQVASLGPDTVRASVLLRLERLPRAGGPVARALAILGEYDVTIRDVAALADVPEDAAAEALAELERSGLVSGAPRLHFTHPILRAAIEDDMPAVERSRAHEQAARMLAEREADPVAVAAHLLVSEPGQGDWARAALRLAARRAEALGDPAAAVHYLERAVEERPEGDELGEILFELGLAAAHAGDPDAAEHLERAAQAGGRTRLRAQHWTAVLHLVAGRAARAADVLESALANVQEEDEAAKPLLETLDRGRARERDGARSARRPLLAPQGAARYPADRLRALRADHARVPGRRGAERRASRDRPHPSRARGGGARLLRVGHARERRQADAGVRAHASGALRRVPRDPGPARARCARLRRPLRRRRLSRRARLGALPRGQRGGRRGGRLGGAPDRAGRHARPRPRADRRIGRRSRRHGAGAALRGARGHRGRAASRRRPGHDRPGRPHPRARMAAARPGRRPRRRRRRARAGSRGLLGLQLADAPAVALGGLGGARTAR